MNIRDHLYRIKHYTFDDPLNKGRKIFYVYNYIKWLLFYKNRGKKFLVRLQNNCVSWVYPFPDHDAGEANIFTRNVDFYDNEFIRKNINKGDFIVDAGCNVGNRTLVLSDIISGALMIDANPRAIERVKENLLLNQLDLKNYFFVSKAVGDQNGDVYFTNIGGASTQNHVTAISTAGNNSINKVEMTTIDEEISLIRKNPSFIKIDVEGYDLQTLSGTKRTLTNGGVRLVKFEINNKNQLNEISEFFNSIQWLVFALNEKGTPSLDKKWIHNNANLFACPENVFNFLRN